MARYNVKDPSGQMHVIDGPDNATPDEVIAQAQKLIPAQSEQQTQPEPLLNRAADTINKGMQAISMTGDYQGTTNTMEPQGQNLFNKAGGDLAEYLGKKQVNPYVAAGAGTAVSMLNPQNWITPNAPGRTPLPGQSGLQETAQEAGRKALGYTKRFLNKPGAVEKANEVAQTMLDQGVITNPITHPLSSGASDMLDRAQTLSDTAGQGIGNSIKKLSDSGKTAFNGSDVANEIKSQLTPKYTGGAYDAEHAAVQEILDTVKAHGEGPLNFNSAQNLKEKLQDLGKFNINTDGVKANLYRRASGIVRDALDRSVAGAASPELPVVQPGSKIGDPHALFAYNDKFGPGGTERSIYNIFGDPNNPAIQKRGFGSSVTKGDLDAVGIPITGRQPNAVGNPLDNIGQVNPDLRSAANDYFLNKQKYGAAEQAEKALTNRVSSEEGNKNIGLTDTIAAGAEIAAGNPVKALVALGAKRALERFYHATKATTADALAKSSIGEATRRAAYASFIDRVTTRPESQ